MKLFFMSFVRKAINGIIPGLFFVLTVSGVTYALTYNWSDPSSIRGRTAGNPLTSSGWNLLVGNVDNLNERITTVEGNGVMAPGGAVMAFNLDNCPNGWTALASANGRTIVGIGSDGQGNTYTRGVTGGEARHTLTTNEMPSHSHSVNDPGHTHSYFVYSEPGGTGPHSDNYSYQGNQGAFGTSVGYTNISINANGGSQSHENRMPFLALLYCQKN